MIQRIQSLWLLLAGAAGFFIYKYPLWSGKLQDGSLKNFLGSESLAFFALMVITCLLGWATIFLFRNRKLQKNLALLGFLFSVVMVVLEFIYVDDYKKSMNFVESSWKFTAILPILMVILFFLAYQGIRKDEKLVKSLDRLR